MDSNASEQNWLVKSVQTKVTFSKTTTTITTATTKHALASNFICYLIIIKILVKYFSCKIENCRVFSIVNRHKGQTSEMF